MLACVLAFAAVCPVAGPPSPPVHFRVTLNLAWEVDRTPAGLHKQNGNATEVAFLSVSLADTAGGQAAHVVIDSMTTQGNGLMEMAFDSSVGRSAKGVSFHLLLVGGKARTQAVPSVMSPATSSLAQAVALLFPMMHRKSSIGDSWPDTTVTSTTGRAGVQSGLSITQWKVTAIHGDTVTLVGATNGHSTVTGTMPSTSTATATRTMTIGFQGMPWTATSEALQRMVSTRSDSTEHMAAEVRASIAIARIP